MKEKWEILRKSAKRTIIKMLPIIFHLGFFVSKLFLTYLL